MSTAPKPPAPMQPPAKPATPPLMVEALEALVKYLDGHVRYGAMAGGNVDEVVTKMRDAIAHMKGQ